MINSNLKIMGPEWDLTSLSRRPSIQVFPPVGSLPDGNTDYSPNDITWSI